MIPFFSLGSSGEFEDLYVSLNDNILHVFTIEVGLDKK